MSDPSFLLTTPTITDPSLAPAGRHTYYALFPTPNLVTGRDIDWTRKRDRYRDHILDTIEERGYAGFRDGIECEHLVTPADWRAQGIAAGAPFAAAHRFTQTGPFRPATLDRRVENLVYTGSNTQPGRRRADGARVGTAGRAAGDRHMSALTVRELDAAGITDPALRASYRLCRALNARHGRTYFLATLLLPQPKRPYVHALYGFARHVDDMVDVARQRAVSREWCDDFLAELDWGATSDPVVSGRARHGRAVADPAQLLRRLPRLDADGPHGHRLRDLRRPGPLHVGFGCGDRLADAADPRPRRPRHRRGTGSRRRRSTSATRSS